MGKGGPKTRYQWNMDAIRTLKQIESENRLATPEEQKVLSKFKLYPIQLASLHWCRHTSKEVTDTHGWL